MSHECSTFIHIAIFWRSVILLLIANYVEEKLLARRQPGFVRLVQEDVLWFMMCYSLTLRGVVFLLALHHHRGIHRHCLGFFQRLSAIGKPALDQVDDGRYGLSGSEGCSPRWYAIPNHPHVRKFYRYQESDGGWLLALLVIAWLINDFKSMQPASCRKLQTFIFLSSRIIQVPVSYSMFFTAAQYVHVRLSTYTIRISQYAYINYIYIYLHTYGICMYDEVWKCFDIFSRFVAFTLLIDVVKSIQPM